MSTSMSTIHLFMATEVMIDAHRGLFKEGDQPVPLSNAQSLVLVDLDAQLPVIPLLDHTTLAKHLSACSPCLAAFTYH